MFLCGCLCRRLRRLDSPRLLVESCLLGSQGVLLCFQPLQKSCLFCGETLLEGEVLLLELFLCLLLLLLQLPGRVLSLELCGRRSFYLCVHQPLRVLRTLPSSLCLRGRLCVHQSLRA